MGPTTPTRPKTAPGLLDDDFLVLVNSWWEPLGFVLPATRPRAQWQAEIDSYYSVPGVPGGPAARSGDQSPSVPARRCPAYRVTAMSTARKSCLVSRAAGSR